MIHAKPANLPAPTHPSPLNFIEQKDADQSPNTVILLRYAVTSVLARSPHSFSLGIEEEYQTIDPVTRDLRSHTPTSLLAQGKLRLQERVKAEMHTSIIEVGTCWFWTGRIRH
jgi:hypothetical protein